MKERKFPNISEKEKRHYNKQAFIVIAILTSVLIVSYTSYTEITKEDYGYTYANDNVKIYIFAIFLLQNPKVSIQQATKNTAKTKTGGYHTQI